MSIPRRRAPLISALIAGIALCFVVAQGGSSALAFVCRSGSESSPMRPNAIAFWNARDGLVGLGNDCYHDTPGAIELTTDGGKTFHKVFDTDGAVSWLDTAGASDAWAVAQANDEDTFTFRTTDGGQTWEELPYSQTYQPSFAAALDGIGFSGTGRDPDARYYVTTADGGNSWQRQQAPCATPEQGIASLASPRRAWALCLYDAEVSNQQKVLYASRTGGRKWTKLESVDLGDCSHGLCSLGYPSSISFSAQGLGFIVQDDFGGYISRNGGRSWKYLRKVGWTSSASMVSRRGGFVLSYRKRAVLLRTDDAGRSFHPVHHWALDG